MQDQKFRDEDQLELEAHFVARVQSYIELGETPEQALLSAREKFGAVETALREVGTQCRLRHPLVYTSVALLATVIYLPLSWVVPWIELAGTLQTTLPTAMTLLLLALASLLALGVIAIPFWLGRWMGKKPMPTRAVRLGVTLGAGLVCFTGLLNKDPQTIFRLMELVGLASGIWIGTWTKEWEQSLLWRYWMKKGKGKGYAIANWFYDGKRSSRA